MFILAGVATTAFSQDSTADAAADTALSVQSDDSASDAAATESARDTARVRRYKKRTIITVAEDSDDSSDVIIVRETKDTVYIAKKSGFASTIRRRKREVSTWRKKGFGIGGGPTPAFHAISMSPVKELAERTPALQGKSFDFGPLDYRPVRMRGGMGYFGFGNGLRIGGGGSGGKTDIISDRFSGDSSLVLETHTGYGGFLIEKAFVRNRFNFNLGGYLGGGDIEVRVKHVDFSTMEWIDFDGEVNTSDKIEANFMLIDLHGGFTYTIVPIFHVGLNVSAPTFISPNGFSSPAVPYSSEFFTINPGVQLRIIFGNLG
jgi:hypothetical protein